MPSTEYTIYTIIGNHPILKYITKFRLTKSAADGLAATLNRLGYEVTISKCSKLKAS